MPASESSSASRTLEFPATTTKGALYLREEADGWIGYARGPLIGEARGHVHLNASALVELDLTGVVEEDLPVLAAFGKQGPSAVSLTDVIVGEELTSAIAGLTQVRDIDLSGSRLDDAAWKALAATRVSGLILARTNLTDAGVEEIARVASYYLDLSATAVTERCISKLRAAGPDVARIDVTGTLIGEAGLEAAARAGLNLFQERDEELELPGFAG